MLKSIRVWAFLGAIVSIVSCVSLKNVWAEDRPEDVLVDKSGNVTDVFVRLLGLTGIRIQSDPVSAESNWPEAKIVLESRSLKEVVQVVQGKKDPSISWIIKGERWSTQGLSYLNVDPEQSQAILNLILKGLGLGRVEKPKKSDYKGILFLGSTLKNARERLKFLNQCLEEKTIHFEDVYLLTGTRPLDPKAGETSESLMNPGDTIPVRSDWNLPEGGDVPTDEGSMILWVFHQSACEHIHQKPLKLIYSGVGEGRARATTQTTVEEWLKGNPEDGLYLAVSSQPFNLYQRLVLERILFKSHRNGIQIEIVGGGVPDQFYILDAKKQEDLAKYASIALDNLARTLYELEIRQRGF